MDMARMILNAVVTFVIVVTEAFVHYNYVKNREQYDRIDNLENDLNESNDPLNKTKFRFFIPEIDKVWDLAQTAIIISISASIISNGLVRYWKLKI